jgi:hypothetical protein
MKTRDKPQAKPIINYIKNLHIWKEQNVKFVNQPTTHRFQILEHSQLES